MDACNLDNAIKHFFYIMLLIIGLAGLCIPGSAFEDTAERYPNNDISDYWTVYNYRFITSVSPFPTDSTNHAIKLATNGGADTWCYATINTTTPMYEGYATWVVKNVSVTCKTYDGTPRQGGGVVYYVSLINPDGSYAVYESQFFNSGYINQVLNMNESVYELASIGGRLLLYKDGVYIQDCGAAPANPCYLKLKIMIWGESNTVANGAVYLDDIASYSVLGMPGTFTELNDNIGWTWNIAAFESYSSSDFKIKLYGISNPNPGEVLTQDITTHSGFTQISRTELGENEFGLYMLELTRDNEILYDCYFWYGQSSSGQELPEIILTAESDVSAEIRDEDSNGGEIPAGYRIYLYPELNENGIYDIYVTLLEQPTAFKTDFTRIYNTTSLNGVSVHYAGLKETPLNVSIDSTIQGSTDGDTTYLLPVTWGAVNTHSISFAPDYSKPGAYGYVKNIETNNPIQHAYVTLQNSTFSSSVYTDEQGLYYISKGVTAGESYSVNATKPGYSAAPTQFITAENGVTTRQDFFLDRSSGAGLYYATHDVTFTVYQYWYSGAGLEGVEYNVTDDENYEVKSGRTGSKGAFTVSDMDPEINYTILLEYQGEVFEKHIEPGLTEYSIVLNKEGAIQTYYTDWLSVNSTNAEGALSVEYTATKPLTGATLTVKAQNGTVVQEETLTDEAGEFNFNYPDGEYTAVLKVDATDGDTSSTSWGLSAKPQISLFGDIGQPLKNILYVGIILLFTLPFGRTRTDIACMAAAVLISMGKFFGWLECPAAFPVLIWLIALGAVYLHQKRTGSTG